MRHIAGLSRNWASPRISLGGLGQLPKGSLVLTGIRTLGTNMTRAATHTPGGKLHSAAVQALGATRISLALALAELEIFTQILTIPQLGSKLTGCWTLRRRFARLSRLR